MKRTNRLTEGNILHTLIRFAVPVFFTLFLQALYGGVDLLVVGQFAATTDVSGGGPAGWQPGLRSQHRMQPPRPR